MSSCVSSSELKRVEGRETHTSGNVPDDTGDGSSERVVGSLGLSNVLKERKEETKQESARAHLPLLFPPKDKSKSTTHILHQLSDLPIRASDHLLVHNLPGNGVEELNVLLAQRLVVLLVSGGSRERRKVDLPDGRNKGDDLDTVSDLEVLLSDGSSGDST